ncbi:hypothetical protein MASR1M45_19630 [Candidatus Kapaibacterium sp.]
MPKFEKQDKAKLLDYSTDIGGEPITNPSIIADKLNKLYYSSKDMI